MTGDGQQPHVDEGDRKEAREIIASLVSASAAARGRRPRRHWYDRLVGTEQPPIEALLVMTAAGQVGAYMTEDGSCVLRCRGDANVNRHLRAVLPDERLWNEAERAWQIPATRIEDAFAYLSAARRRAESQVDGHDGHSLESAETVEEEPAVTSPVVMNSRYGMMSGQQRGDVVEVMVLDPRMQSDLRERGRIGTYRQDRLIGLWEVDAADFRAAAEWATARES